ncbi:MAG: hypothetical protein L6R48_17205 [Planctomycetes bacterium]|nr:hypothetical protein [Planctomycetota bacterium]
MLRAADAALLLHRDPRSGPHLDLVLGRGARCPTLSFRRAGRGWTGGWIAPHRRAWLTRSGPVSGGRGSAQRLWRGPAAWWRIPGGWRIALPGAGLALRGKRVECGGWLATMAGA